MKIGRENITGRRASIRRIVATAGAVGLAGLAFATGPAITGHAATGATVACSFQGAANISGDSQTADGFLGNGGPYVPSPVAGNIGKAGLNWFSTADTGNYGFTTVGTTLGAKCVVVVNGGPVVIAKIISAGVYQNVKCGNGEADGSATLYDQNGVAVTTIYYSIFFKGGAGVLVAASTLGGTPTITGVVDITPTPTTGCTLSEASGFNVVGSASGGITA
jgi:hypothetical protein